MTSATVRRPRRAVRKRQVAAAIEPSDLKRLRESWNRRELVLLLGAGVSIPYGLPTWKNFVLPLLFQQARRTRGLGSGRSRSR